MLRGPGGGDLGQLESRHSWHWPAQIAMIRQVSGIRQRSVDHG